MTKVAQFEARVEKTIRSRRMLEPGERLIVAVSGGPDSVALLLALVALRTPWNLTVSVAHCGHGLRGHESREDGEFVRDLCRRLGVPLTVLPLEIHPATARRAKMSLQHYARNLRYQALSRLAAATGASKVALGHTADDQAETVLMWMLRGAGTGGLKGMLPVREGGVIRPLLERNRLEILEYLGAKGEPYRVDSSNAKPLYLRNRIRHELIPVLKTFNPNLIKGLCRQADIVQEEDAYLDHVAEVALGQASQGATGSDQMALSRHSLFGWPLGIRRRVIGLALQRQSGQVHRPPYEIVERILERVAGGQSGTAAEWLSLRIVREYDKIVIARRDSPEEFIQDPARFERLVEIPSRTPWPPTGQAIQVSRRPAGAMHWESDGNQAWLDANTFSPSLRLRGWKPGDDFCPLGLGGRRKKLKEFFADEKVPRSQRSRIPLLVAPEGIVWVGGYRLDHRFRITDLTRDVVVVQLTSELN